MSMFTQEFIINENGRVQGHGPTANMLASSMIGNRIEPGLMRPYYNEDDGYKPTVCINSGRFENVEVTRAGIKRNVRRPIYTEARVKDLQDDGIQMPAMALNGTSLQKGEWLLYDDATIEPQRERLRLIDDVGRMNTYTFEGLGVKILENETVSDPGQAFQSMDGLHEGTNDTPDFQLEGWPVPVTTANFSLDLRTLESSRRGRQPLSTRGVEWATRRCMEKIDEVGIGVAGSALLYGGNSTQVGGYGRTSGNYGLLNFPDRITKTDLTVPTGANPNATVEDVLEMRQLMYDAKHYGPYGIYHSTDWDIYMDSDYAFVNSTGWAVNPTMTLRQRLLAIGTEGGDGTGNTEQKQIKFVKRLDTLTPANSHAFTLIMVSMKPGVIRRCNGMPVTIFQYDLMGGWKLCFRVVTIQFLQMFADYYGNCGVLHARTA